VILIFPLWFLNCKVWFLSSQAEFGWAGAGTVHSLLLIEDYCEYPWVSLVLQHAISTISDITYTSANRSCDIFHQLWYLISDIHLHEMKKDSRCIRVGLVLLGIELWLKKIELWLHLESFIIPIIEAVISFLACLDGS
jgi:hypothetical protein